MSDANSPDQVNLGDLDFNLTCDVDDNAAAWALITRCCGTATSLACQHCKDTSLAEALRVEAARPGVCIHCHTRTVSAGQSFELRAL